MGLHQTENRIFEKLPEILSNYIEDSDAVAILDELRHHVVGATTPLKEIHSQVLNCTKCPGMKPEQHLPKFNLQDPDLLVVNGYPWTGGESDIALAKLLKNNGFGSNNIAFTSIVRCFPQEKRTPDAEEINRCTELYLYDEIQSLKPKLIALVGSAPSKLFLGEETSISQANGQIFWLGAWAFIPILSAKYAEQSNQIQRLNNALASAFEFLYPTSSSLKE